MRSGILVPNYGEYCGSVRNLIELAVEGESLGWDGLFLFDHIHYTGDESLPMVDPWVALAAIAVKTERIRLGTLVTPLPRRRPWKLARETVSIDHLSGGRLILGVGLGDAIDVEFESFGEDVDSSIRAAKLDEGLEILVRMWSGERFNYQGRYVAARNAQFLPRSLQTPRIPIWVAGRWPKQAPFRRAARWDGAFPLGLARGSTLKPDELRKVSDFIKSQRTIAEPYDIVATSGADGHLENEDTLLAYADAGGNMVDARHETLVQFSRGVDGSS